MLPTQQQQIDALRAALGGLQARLDVADRTREDTHRRVQDMQGKVDAMYNALMQPQIGQGDQSLIVRMASVTVEIESGKRTARFALWVFGFFAAAGAGLAVFTLGAPK
jgi:hypothetical protein